MTEVSTALAAELPWASLGIVEPLFRAPFGDLTANRYAFTQFLRPRERAATPEETGRAERINALAASVLAAGGDHAGFALLGDATGRSSFLGSGFEAHACAFDPAGCFALFAGNVTGLSIGLSAGADMYTGDDMAMSSRWSSSDIPSVKRWEQGLWLWTRDVMRQLKGTGVAPVVWDQRGGSLRSAG